MPTNFTGQHLFNLVAHPQLKNIGRKSIHTFLPERELYLLPIADAQASGSSITPIRVKSSVDYVVIQSLVSSGEFGEIKEVSELTEHTLITRLEGKDDSRKKEMTKEELDAAVSRSVRITVNEDDLNFELLVWLRTMSLFCAPEKSKTCYCQTRRLLLVTFDRF